MPKGEEHKRKRELEYQSTAAHSLRYQRDNQLFFVSSLPMSSSLSKDSYYFLRNGDSYYIDNEGQKHTLDIKADNVLKILRKKESEENVKRFLRNGCDFIIAEQLPKDPVEMVRQSGSKHPRAYIYSNNQVYYVDLRDNRYKKVELTDEQTAHLHAQLDIPYLEPHEVKKTTLRQNQLGWIQQNILKPYEVSDLDEMPLNSSLDHKDLNALWAMVNHCKEHSLGQYKILKAVVDPHDYPPNHGILLEGNPTSPYDDNDEDSILDMVNESLRKTFLKDPWLEEQKDFVLQHSVKNPEIYSKLVEKAIEHFFHSGGSSTHPGSMATMQFQARRNLYNTTVVRPRLEMVFPLNGSISKNNLRARHQLGTVVGHELALGRIPQSIAEVWVVTDQDASNAELHGLHTEPEPQAKDQPSTFVCFSELDAKNLIKQLRSNRDFNLRLCNSEPPQLDSLDKDQNINEMVAREYLEHIKPVLFAYLEGLLNMKISHDGYKRYMDGVNSNYLNSPEPMDDRLKARVSTDDYPYFERFNQIQEQLKELIAVVVDNIDKDKLNYQQLNNQFEVFEQQLKGFVKSYPFREVNHSIVHYMFHHLIELKNNIPDLVADKKEEHQKVIKERYASSSSTLFSEAKHDKKPKMPDITLDDQDDKLKP